MTEQSRRSRRTLIVAAIAIFAVGFGVGFYLQYKRLKEFMGLFKGAHEHMVVYRYSEVQYREAAYKAAKAALERHMRYLDSTASQPHPFRDAGGNPFDKSILHGRLALLEEREIGTQAAEPQWAKAEEYFRQSRVKDRSREYLRRFIVHLDGSWPEPLKIFPNAPR